VHEKPMQLVVIAIARDLQPFALLGTARKHKPLIKKVHRPIENLAISTDRQSFPPRKMGLQFFCRPIFSLEIAFK